MDVAVDNPAEGAAPAGRPVGSLLVVRPAGLGSVVRAVPALRHLRSAWPEAVITIAARGDALELLRGCPFVDRCIAIERASEALLERYDLAISLGAPGERCPVDLSAVDARTRAAWRGSDADPVAHEVHPVWPARSDDAARMLRMAWLLGGRSSRRELALWPTLIDRTAAGSLLEGAGDQPVAVVHAGAGHAARRWGPAGFARVAALLADVGLRVAVVGTSRDRVASQALAAASDCGDGGVIDLVGRTGVGELAGVLERSALFVGNDSGPAALAAALGVRSIIVGPRSALESSALPKLVDVVTAGPCGSCGEPACAHPAPAAREVGVEPVLSQVLVAARQARGAWLRQRVA